MPQLRKDPIVDRWVIVAESRSQRPGAFVAAAAEPDRSEDCPFCEGRESRTPPETLALRAAGTAADAPGWRVRVVPNRYPALEAGDRSLLVGEGLWQCQPGAGVHEVIIESPAHQCQFGQLTDRQVGDVFWVYRQRLVEVATQPEVRYGLIFKNSGAAAGATLPHAHSQLLGLPLVPGSVLEEISAGQNTHRRQGCCAWCALIEAELAERQRLVAETTRFVAFCAYAGRFPYETWILPKAHQSDYRAIERDAADEIAQLTRAVLSHLENLVPGLAYNYFVHTTPFDMPQIPHYHWHLEILPRLTTTAGFEWGSGYGINPVAPEEAAARLRSHMETSA